MDDGPPGFERLHQPRLAELVADALRRRILSGAHPDGELLTRYEAITEEFQVSLPSAREALRMLEAEGLLTMRRGKSGGAVVQAPRSENVAYGIGLFLEYKRTDVSELALALRMLEPVCASACAERPDRHTTVVPRLRAVLRESESVIDDASHFAHLARDFHERIVEGCPNEVTRLIVGALESLWSAQVRSAPSDGQELGTFPDRETRECSLQDHARLLRRIEDGDVAGAAQVAREHFSRPERPVLLQHRMAVRAEPLRPC